MHVQTLKKTAVMTLAALALVCTEKGKTSEGGVHPAHAKIVSVQASSTLQDKANRYNARHLTDGQADSWCEGVQDDGVGQSFTLVFNQKVEFDVFYFKNGLGIPNYWAKNNRVRTLSINGQPAALTDQGSYQKVKLAAPIAGKKITFEIKSVYRGSKFRDTCISEIAFTPRKEPIQKGAVKKLVGSWHVGYGAGRGPGECAFGAHIGSIKIARDGDCSYKPESGIGIDAPHCLAELRVHGKNLVFGPMKCRVAFVGNIATIEWGGPVPGNIKDAAKVTPCEGNTTMFTYTKEQVDADQWQGQLRYKSGCLNGVSIDSSE